jgi:Tol biopolymer transport system component
MATGTLPFRGDTTGAIFDSILNRAPVAPVRINPDTPAKLEDLINKALEKDRNVRYQSAAELRADLKRLKRDTDAAARPATSVRPVPPLKSRLRLKWLLLTACILITVGAVFIGHRLWLKSAIQVPKGSLKLKLLTANSAESYIDYAIISPDGKFLAYNQKAGGLVLSLIETGETRVLTPVKSDIFLLDWFPDGTQLLVIKASENSLWKMSVLTGVVSKIRDNVTFAIVSRDGLHIFYLDGKSHDYWVMGPAGDGARRVMAIDPTDEVYAFAWAPTGQRFAYMITHRGPGAKEDTRIESRDIEGKQQPTVIVSNPLVAAQDLYWMADGRLIYSLPEPPPNQNDSNIWAIRVDPVKGAVNGEPERLTNWTGFSVGAFSATADGKRLAFIKEHRQHSIYIAPLGTDGKLGKGKTERLTTDTWSKPLDGWTHDSHAIYFSLRRNGKISIYKQGIHQQAPERVISGPEDYSNARLTPDGTTLLYTASDPTRLMSMPAEGGTSTVLVSGEYGYECARPPSSACVLSEQKGDNLNFYTLDPKKGPATKPLKTIGTIPENWSLSPDGKYIALVENNNKADVQVLDLSKDKIRRLNLGKWTRLQTVGWSHDGKVLYVTSYALWGTTLLSVDLDGNVTSAYQQGNWLCCPKVAPNGRLLVFNVAEFQRDVAVIENF